MPAFYHVCPILLAPGSIILPGNWGRIITARGAAHTNWQNEQVLETLRLQKYPQKPSRLRSAFACLDIDALRLFKNRNCPNGAVYEVEFLDPNAIFHEADFNYIQSGFNLTMEQIAELYWEGQRRVTITDAPGIVCTERLAETGLRILRAVVV